MTLETRGVHSGYAKSLVCHDVDIRIESGERVCILGRNGVGKTTFLKSVMGILSTSRGQTFIDGTDVSRYPSFRRARMGVGYVPQGRGIFGKLTVQDNLGLGTVAEKRRIEDVDERLFEYFPILKERLRQMAGTLSGGEQQMLSIARSLAGNPRLLLLDEPSEGIQPNIIQSLGEIIQRISVERGLAILLVEQNIDFALDIVSRGYVMEKGTIVESGSARDLRNDGVVQSYLGV